MTELKEKRLCGARSAQPEGWQAAKRGSAASDTSTVTGCEVTCSAKTTLVMPQMDAHSIFCTQGVDNASGAVAVEEAVSVIEDVCVNALSVAI